LEHTTPWDSDKDFATEKFYFNNKLAYTVELFSGKERNLVITNKYGYDQLMAMKPSTGLELFKQNCTQCHSSDRDIVGPKLRGVTDRRTNEWLKKMIINGDALVKSGDKDAVEMYDKWYHVKHPDFEMLTKKEVNLIIEYLKTLK
jgi:mono/diheme cytochrome c family protein